MYLTEITEYAEIRIKGNEQAKGLIAKNFNAKSLNPVQRSCVCVVFVCPDWLSDHGFDSMSDASSGSEILVCDDSESEDFLVVDQARAQGRGKWKRRKLVLSTVGPFMLVAVFATSNTKAPFAQSLREQTGQALHIQSGLLQDQMRRDGGVWGADCP